MNAPLNESFNGLIQRSDIRQETVTGPGHATHISNVADFSATLHLSEHFRLVDTFRFWAYRIPESFSSIETDWTCIDTVNLLVTHSDQRDHTERNQHRQPICHSTRVGRGTRSISCGMRRSTSEAASDSDMATRSFIRSLTSRLETRTGLSSTNTPRCSHFGQSLRQACDSISTGNTRTTTTPSCASGRARRTATAFQGNYTPKPWAVIGASINLWGASNGDALTDYRAHNRNYGFTANLTPRERFGFDFAYNYNDTMQNALICFNDSDTTLPVVANAGSCTANGFNDSKNPLLTEWRYTSNTHYGMASVMFKPHARVTAQVGYSITSTDGQTPQFDVLQPLGSLQYNYHQPLANISVDIGHNLTAKAGMELLPVRRGILCGTYRSPLFPRQQCDIFSALGFLNRRSSEYRDKTSRKRRKKRSEPGGKVARRE